MNILTVSEWKKRIGDADATHCSDSYAAAREILNYLGARTGSGRLVNLANALVAYASLLHDEGVTP